MREFAKGRKTIIVAVYDGSAPQCKEDLEEAKAAAHKAERLGVHSFQDLKARVMAENDYRRIDALKDRFEEQVKEMERYIVGHRR